MDATGSRRAAAGAAALLLAGAVPGAAAEPLAETSPAPAVTLHPVAAVPQLMAAAPGGEVWYVEGRRLGRMTAAGEAKNLGDLPADATGMAPGPEGGLWVAGCAALHLLGPGGASRRAVRLPEGTCATAVAAGRDGEAWFGADSAEGGRIGRVAADGGLTLLPVRPDGMVPRSLAYGPSGALWFVESAPDARDVPPPAAVSRLDPARPRAARRTPLPADACPGAVAAGADGAAWFPQLCGQAGLGRVGADGTVADVALADPAHRAAAVTAGADGAMWYRTEAGLGRLAPGGEVTAVAVPARADLAHGGPLVAGADGAVWFAGGDRDVRGGGLLGRVPVEAPRDGTPPAVRCARPPARWHAADVAVACSATDAGGLAQAGDASFTLRTTVPYGTETASAATGTRTVCDRAGNCTVAGPVRGLRVDRRAPAVALRAPADDEGYALTSRRPADYSCIDRGSGLASCRGTVPDGEPVPTGAPGRRSFVVTAVDEAGNTRRVTHLYRVGVVRTESSNPPP